MILIDMTVAKCAQVPEKQGFLIDQLGVKTNRDSFKDKDIEKE